MVGGLDLAKKRWFWVAQRFSAAIRAPFLLAALAAEVVNTSFFVILFTAASGDLFGGTFGFPAQRRTASSEIERA